MQFPFDQQPRELRGHFAPDASDQAPGRRQVLERQTAVQQPRCADRADAGHASQSVGGVPAQRPVVAPLGRRDPVAGLHQRDVRQPFAGSPPGVQ